ncbi:MAG: C40 family peptidase [Endomicrobium sp.]|jgi:hypothetical protein|nr:C40 family peptidase [Endomicrobium sp.]
MKAKYLLLVLCFFLFSCSSKKILVPHFEVTSNIAREMKSPGFWVSKLQNPDKIILTEKQIKEFNLKIRENSPFLKDIFSIDIDKEKKKRNHKIDYINDLKKRSKYYDANSSKQVGTKFFQSIKENIDTNASINLKFALTIGYARLRALPTKTSLCSSLDTLDLKSLVLTLNPCSPLAVLYSTKDNKWYYVISEISEGWIQAEQITFASKEAIFNFLNDKNIAVVTSRFADLYKDSALTVFYDNIKMGTILYISKVKGNIIEIKIPTLNGENSSNEKLDFEHYYVKKSDVFLGFLPYTQRNVIVQAFKQIDAPYDLGDNYGYTDCSGFIKQVFSCFGIKLPRNSRQQINIKDAIDLNGDSTLKAKTIISDGVGGITLLYFPGHIMLYLGYFDNNPYVIHSIRGYSGKNNKIHILNKVAVTDLTLGYKSKNRSLLDRTTLMNVVGLDEKN